MALQSFYAADCETVVEQFGDMVYRLALARCASPSDAEDVFQEVFLRFMRSRGKITSEEHCKAWLLRVTINCSKNLLSARGNSQTLPLDDLLPAPEREDLRDVYDAVQKLPLKYRTAVHLFYYEDLPIRKIAEIMRARESTVKSWLHRARALLKADLAKEYSHV